MPRYSPTGLAGPNLLIFAAALIALVAIAGCSLGVVAAGASGSPATPAPSTPLPGGVDGIVIPLDVFQPHDVQLAISDREGLIAQVSSGQAADGMSTGWAQAIVRNAGPRTIEVVWTGIPRDELVTLVARTDGDRVLLRFGQEAPPENSDLMGADRIVVLTFAEPIDAGRVVTDFTTVDD